jgi:hypothetical protein
MKIPTTAPLFAWQHLDDEPDLKTLKETLDRIDDREILAELSRRRGNGRDDFPVHVLWRTLLAASVLRHPTMDACLAELSRNEGLRRVIGIAPAGPVPNAWNMSRFTKTLGAPEILERMQAAFAWHVSELATRIPSLGVHTAGDSTHISVRKEEEQSATQPQAAGQRVARKTKAKSALAQPAGGKKEYVDESGKVTRVLSWWGYKVHLVVDVKHEVALSFRITSANDPDNASVVPTLDQAIRALPGDRMKTHAYDKAADDRKVHEALAERAIKPVIQLRALANGATMEQPILGRGGVPTPFVHDEAGSVFCYDTVSDPPVRHPAKYWGQDPERRTLKYRCPAAADGFSCPSFKHCNGDSEYGRAIRIKFEQAPDCGMGAGASRRSRGRPRRSRLSTRDARQWSG